MPATEKTSFQLIPIQRQFHTDLTQDIQTATRQVDLEFYVLQKDNATRPIFTALEHASRRGVRVRILVDHMFAAKNPVFGPIASIRLRKRLQQLQKEGLPIELRKSPIQKEDSHHPFRKDHKKLAIIDPGEDTQKAYIGGANIAVNHADWRDFMVQVTGQPVQLLETDFQKTWDRQNTGFQQYKLNDADGTEILSDNRLSEGIQERVIQEITTAKNRIWLDTAYVDRNKVRNALIAAKKKNPALDILLLAAHPATSNDPRYHLLPSLWLRKYVKNDIPVFLFGRKNKQFTHAKALLIDDTTFIGSSNFTDDILSGGDAEVILLSKNKQLYQQVEQWIQDGVAQSEKYK